MIIGNNKNNNFNNSFNDNIKNPLIEDNRTRQHTDVTSKTEMADKSFSMLQERYQNGLISLEEFTKQCNKLNKLRQKQ